MSNHWVLLVPDDPNFVPAPEDQLRALERLRHLAPRADEVTAEEKEAVEFIDPGGNWSGVQCPRCNADAEAWWSAAVSDAYAGGFRCLDVTVPCCDSVVSLNDLRYVWPAAFAKFVLSAMNAGIGELSTDEVEEFGRILGCSVRQVLRHL